MVSNFQIDKIQIQSTYHRTMAELSLPFSIESSRVVILTGAGISAESGIKTFRDNDGLWETHKVEDVATPHAWNQNPELVWKFYQQRRKQLLEVRPNPAHNALVALSSVSSTLIPKLATLSLIASFIFCSLINLYFSFILSIRCWTSS